MIPLGLVALILPFNLVIKEIKLVNGTFLPVNGPLFLLYAFVCAYFVLATLNNFVIQYLNNLGYKRQRILYVVLGLVVFLSIALLCDVLLPAFGITAFKFIGPLSSGIFLLMSSWTLITYNLMDIRLVMKSVIVNAFSFIISVAFTVYGHDYFRQSFTDYQSFALLFLGAITLFVLTRGIFSWLFSYFFLKNYFTFRNSFDELNLFLHEEINTDRIITLVNKNIKEGLGLSWIYYFDSIKHKAIFEPNTNPIEAKVIESDQIYDSGFNDYASGVHSAKFFYGVEFEAFPKISNAPIAILPLWNKGENRGYFVLGPQRSLSGLSLEETHKLQHLWVHMETAYDRALLYEGLEDKVKAQVEDIIYKDRKLKELVQNRLDFIQITSHQLRTPITSLSGALQLVLGRRVDEDQREELVALAYQKSKELSNTIDGVLKIARLEQGEDPKETSECVNLNFVFASLLPVVEAAAKAKNLAVDFQPIAKPMVRGNELYLEQAFYNLLENAIQYTNEGAVRIYFKEEKDFITTCIEDTGDGIAEDLQPRIFSRKSLGINSKGTGLGLYIVKTIVDAHPEGKIYFESGTIGTTFFVKLNRFTKN
ncbi:MAG: hypothetical protein NVSMB66_7510 [Candidatus Doudnabacteria bacterium]